MPRASQKGTPAKCWESGSVYVHFHTSRPISLVTFVLSYMHTFFMVGSLPGEQDIWLRSASDGQEWKHGDGEWTCHGKWVDVFCIIIQICLKISACTLGPRKIILFLQITMTFFNKMSYGGARAKVIMIWINFCARVYIYAFWNDNIFNIYAPHELSITLQA